MQTHFTDRDLAFIITGLLLVTGSIVAFSFSKHRLALVLLIAGGFALRLLMALIDPFVNIWDEQFHAAVARNMMEHPFTPMLYKNPALPYSPDAWAANHIWVHKPPLFLWQMALAMKIFGVKVWALRVPSVLLTTLCIPALYRMGKLLTPSSPATGFYAALLFAAANLLVSVVSGFPCTDHNDVVFMCYVLFSFWAWMEFMSKPLRKWIVLTGVLAGMAVLVKWLPGLLVFGAWFVAVMSDRKTRNIKNLKPIAASFALTVLVAAPWFIYTWLKWPQETALTFALHSKHLVEDLGHPGPWWYHFGLLKEYYGWWMVFLLPPALFFFLKKRDRLFPADNFPVRAGIVSAIVFVYVFYALVKTRMPLFTMMAAPLLLLAIGGLFSRFGQLVARKNYLRFAWLVLLAVFTCMIFDPPRVEYFHTGREAWNVYRPARIHNYTQFEKAVTHLPSGDYVIFNCGPGNGVSCMFYTGFTAYDRLPFEEEFRELKTKGVKMAVFDDLEIPDYMRDDPAVIKLHYPIRREGV